MNQDITQELFHHGIKGQRWGVRRFQEEDGSLTPAGEKRYNKDNDSTKPPGKKLKYRERLEQKYVNKGLSEEAAKKAADDRIKTQKILAVTAGVTVAAASAYLITKHVKERTDQVIKKGDVMQRIEGQKKWFGNKNRNLHDQFYVTNNDYDNRNYQDAFGYQKLRSYGKAYKLKIEAADDIKIASQKKARDVFKDLMTNDEKFLDTLDYRTFTHDLRGNRINLDKKMGLYGKLGIKGDKAPDRFYKQLYENYNALLVGKPLTESEAANRKIFYDALKKQGYGGIQDINDLKVSRLRGTNPLIIFDKSKTNVKSIQNIADQVSRRTRSASYNRMALLRGSQAMSKTLPALAGISVGSLALSFNPGSKSAQNAFVKQYKQQHPNTNLTDKQLKDMYTKGRKSA